MLLSTLARANDTYRINLNVSSEVLPKEQQIENLCYKLASQGEFIEQIITEPKWFESTDDKFVWKTTMWSSGLTCKVLVEGRYNLQTGSGAKKPGCQCQGSVDLLK